MTRKSINLSIELRSLSVDDDQEKFNNKQSELITAISDELGELFQAQEAMDVKLDKIINILESDPKKVETLKSRIETLPLKEEVDALSNKVNSWTQEFDNLKTIVNENKESNNTLTDTLNTVIESNSKLGTEIENLTKYNETDEQMAIIKRDLLQEIDTNSQEIQEIKNCIRNQSLIISSSPNHDISSKLKFPPPSFKGLDTERPIKFLNDLDNYITLKKLSPDESVKILSQTLDGEAKDWWYVHESDVKTYDEFKLLFKDRFWNATIQRNTRRKVEFGQYYPNTKLSRVNYATTILSYAKELDLSYTEDETTENLCNHFEKGIRHAFNGQQVKSKSVLFKILTDYDEDDKKAQVRKQNYEQKKNEEKSEHSNEKINNDSTSNENRKTWQSKNISATQMQKISTKNQSEINVSKFDVNTSKPTSSLN